MPKLELEQTDLWAQHAGYSVYAYCESCHSPDGEGVGACGGYFQDAEEAREWFDEHVETSH